MIYINREIDDIYFQYNILCLYRVSISSFIFSLSVLLKLLKGYLSHMSALGPRPPSPMKFLSAVFDFLPVWVVKCSCAALIKYSFELSIHKY